MKLFTQRFVIFSPGVIVVKYIHLFNIYSPCHLSLVRKSTVWGGHWYGPYVNVIDILCLFVWKLPEFFSSFFQFLFFWDLFINWVVYEGKGVGEGGKKGCKNKSHWWIFFSFQFFFSFFLLLLCKYQTYVWINRQFSQGKNVKFIFWYFFILGWFFPCFWKGLLWVLDF